MTSCKVLHNRRIINARDLSFIPTRMFYRQVIRASADPTRSVKMIYYLKDIHHFFFSCFCSFGSVMIMERRSGCAKGSHCDKLHYCYYALTDTCTKTRCQHEIN